MRDKNTDKKSNDGILTQYFDNIDKIIEDIPTGNKINLSPENSPYITIKGKERLLCNKLDEIKEWTEWSVRLVDMYAQFPKYLIMFLCDITGDSYEFVLNWAENQNDKMIGWINDKFSAGINIKTKKQKKFYRRIMIISAKVNKALKVAQRATYKIMKNVLQKIQGGKLTAVTLKFINPIIVSINLLGKLLSFASDLLTSIIMSLPPMLQLTGEAMGFFITPKSLSTTTLTATNDQSSIFSGISDQLFSTINESIEYQEKNKKAKNVAKISEAGSNAATNESVDEIPSFDDIEVLDYKSIHQKLSEILSIFIQAEALPEYKNLKLTNLGFQIWLNTTFEPGMKRSFGIPGQP